MQFGYQNDFQWHGTLVFQTFQGHNQNMDRLEFLDIDYLN